ncbi:hypothetical protein [Endozoicomonas sp. 4G]|uniref:hypothetical protein n=1 Tax=Endozoicomonas sp. 4G TaxID=2872754 RepID=UPI00207906FF|nr:hypothetical protein [Endozoicomonas sp. 4G]
MCWRRTIIASVLTVLACLLMTACALEPRVLRDKLDECDRYQFDALVYRRARDGAVVKVLCIPDAEEMDLQVEQPALVPMLIKRMVPLLNQ